MVFTSRVHPGESNASWIMQGILDFLTSDSEASAALREQYVFKIVPMLNPDGVINGNYRCSLAGVDLNRRWNNPDPKKHPTVYHTKKLIARLKKMRHVGLIVDIHGHSLKQGAFFYGCTPDKKLLRLRPSSPPLIPHTGVARSRSNRERTRDGLCIFSPNSSSCPPLLASPSFPTDCTLPSASGPGTAAHQLELLSGPGSLLSAPPTPVSATPTQYIAAEYAARRYEEELMKESADSYYDERSPALEHCVEDTTNGSYERLKYSSSFDFNDDDTEAADKTVIPCADSSGPISEDRQTDSVPPLVPASPVSPHAPVQPPNAAHLPHRRSSLRDALFWKVHLFPRICSTLTPLFSLDGCR